MSSNEKGAKSKFSSIFGGAIGAPTLLLVLLAMITVPLPPIMLDALFTVNIALSIMILMISVYVKRHSDFSIFPTVLLGVTLLRLGLNVASTRIILTHGHAGPAGAGHVIEAFGEFVIGGNFAVGIIVFAILMIVSFMVVTKGAERISEVKARFTLDSLPGKQMAIDAELNNGAITAEEAAAKRLELASESEFHGSMDGASKFTKGDAIASILILSINVIGGLAIGVLQHGMPFGEALQHYTLLSIGDGLVAQIPSLILAIATAIIISRTSGHQNLSEMVGKQMFIEPRVFYIAGGILILIGIIPGMPKLSFIGIGVLICGGIYWRSKKIAQEPELSAEVSHDERDFNSDLDAVEMANGDAMTPVVAQELTLDDITPPEPIEIRVGMRLIPLLDSENGADLIEQITGVRKYLSKEMGVLIRGIYVHDAHDIDSESYEIRIRGIVRAEGKIKASMLLAIDMGNSRGSIDGYPTTEPVYGLPAYWISEETASQARSQGYDVSEPATIIVTHLTQVMRDYLHVLLFHEDVCRVIDHLSKKTPKLIEELIPRTLTASRLLEILRNLLQEGISIQDMNTILETLALHAPNGISTMELTALVRKSMIEHIIYNLTGNIKEISIITINHQLQEKLIEGINRDGRIITDGQTLTQLLVNTHKECEDMMSAGLAPIVVVSDQLRVPLIKLLKPQIPEINILCMNELPINIKLDLRAEIN